jgi:hypothetical protein
MVVVLLLFVLAVPAFAKPRNDVYPVSCSDLWDAVKDTLGNAGNYRVMAIDDVAMSASYLIVGATQQHVNSVELNPKDNGCQLQVKAPESVSMSDDETPFRKRVGQSLAKLNPAKPAAPAKPDGKN